MDCHQIKRIVFTFFGDLLDVEVEVVTVWANVNETKHKINLQKQRETKKRIE